jgi:hypothetical protein
MLIGVDESSALNNIFSIAPRLSLGPTSPLYSGYWVLSPGVKQ